MSVTYDDKNRQVIPRCLSYTTACSLGLLRISGKQQTVHQTEVKYSLTREEWIENPSMVSAVDLVAEALIVKDFESIDAIKAAEYILSEAPSSNFLIRQLSNHFLERPTSPWIEPSLTIEIDAERKDIASLKKAVLLYSKDAIAWADLSLHYATLGQDNKAKRAMFIAMTLAKNNNNRYILRSASRCLEHVGEPDWALDILNKSGLCTIDPWIASAEIAIADSSGLKSKCISKAKHLLENNDLTPFSRSELAVGIGTIEIKNGSIKRAKKMIHRALIDPTENALAQAEWAASQFKIDFEGMNGLRSTVPASYEAAAVHAYYSKAFADSLIACKKWGRFQSLSPSPIILSMFLSSCMLNDDLGAIYIFENALPAQKENPAAINNYAVSLARIGRTEDAEKELDRIQITEESGKEKFVITATTGLIHFRKGYIEEGRKLYTNAITGFEYLKDFRSVAIATYYWAIEEKSIKSQYAESKIREAKRRIEQYNVFDFEDLANKL